MWTPSCDCGHVLHSPASSGQQLSHALLVLMNRSGRTAPSSTANAPMAGGKLMQTQHHRLHWTEPHSFCPPPPGLEKGRLLRIPSRPRPSTQDAEANLDKTAGVLQRVPKPPTPKEAWYQKKPCHRCRDWGSASHNC